MSRVGRRERAGRPVGASYAAKPRMSLAVLARQHSEEAIDQLVQVMRYGENDAARVSAAIAILDRAYGKPAQSVEPLRGDIATAKLPTLEEAVAEIKRRGLDKVLQLTPELHEADRKKHEDNNE